MPPANAYVIRRARREDAPAWLDLIEELAVFEKLDPPQPVARRRLTRDAFGPKPRIEVFLATHETQVVGYAIVCWTYSSFLAKPTLWLEDIYITKAHRGTGAADRLLSALSKRAAKEKAGRIEGFVLGWNVHAHAFYERTGGVVKKDWFLLRYDEAALRKNAQRS